MRLDLGLSADYRDGEWSVDSAPSEAVVALNAGQFNGIVPWGWTVKDGRELRPPGVGPLSMAVVADAAGRVRFIPPDSIEAERASGVVVTAMQSYPTLLEGNAAIPVQITNPGLGVGVTDRDARLALCALPDGKLLVLLTRFDGLGEFAGGVPFGLTLRETAQLLKQQGCVRAVALDGGISSQLMVRGTRGGEQAWRAWRKVPMGVVFEER
jgi:exopolysaccharide biosynthesis protein